ncbi:MAG: class I SAM-dependent methyltransferase [Syntrophobacterales bacterium]|nr:class I SAM-dependent methyltransferase [Syntrophobacterales bacterium]
MADRLTAIQNYFEKRVKCYLEAYSTKRLSSLTDAIYRFGWYSLRFIFRRTMRHLAVIQPQSVLDIGCGCGVYSLEIARRGAMVTALDICRGMIDATESLLKQNGLQDRVTTICANYLDWSKGVTHEYDLILAIGLFDYVHDAGHYLTSFRRITKGAIITFPADYALSSLAQLSYRSHGIQGYFYTKQQIEELLLSAGFKIVHFSKLFPGTYMVHAVCAL